MRGLVVTCAVAILAGCGGLTTAASDAAPEAASRDAAASDDAAPAAPDATTRDAPEAEAGPSCPASFTPCSDGVCANLQSDPDNCGACGNACEPAAVCLMGACSILCGGGATLCDGSCVDLASDPHNCGACDNVCDDPCPPCPPANACQNGVCVTGGACTLCCPAGEVDCNGACIDPTTSTQFCGASGNCVGGSSGQTCEAGEVCSGAVCVIICFPGWVLCSTTCVDPATDPFHCGATGDCQGVDEGVVCAPGAVCSGGVCVVVTFDGG